MLEYISDQGSACGPLDPIFPASNFYAETSFNNSPMLFISDPAIGFELECRGIPLDNSSEKATSIGEDYHISACLKGNAFIIPGATHSSNWALTAETVSNSIKRIATEAVVRGPEGKGVKFSSNSEIGMTIGNEIVAAVKKWAPHKGLQVKVKGFEKFGSWTVQSPKFYSPYLGWGLQVTAPFPLSGILSMIFKPSALLERRSVQAYPTLTKESLPWIGSKKDGTAKYLDNHDVLGFLTIVLAYVNAAKTNDPAQGPKSSSSIMPRTDFRTMYIRTGVKAVVEDWIRGVRKNPDVKAHYGFEVVDLKKFVLAVGLDCGFRPRGETDFPTTLVLRWENRHNTRDEIHCLTIGDWLADLQKIQNGVDLVSLYDKKYQAGQIGGLGNKMEKIIGGVRALPIFEFRDLSSGFTEAIPKSLQECERAVRDAHKNSL